MRICHFITGLGNGGAEAALFRLISNSRDQRHLVVSLTEGGAYRDKLETAGIEVASLALGTSRGFVAWPKVMSAIRAFRPEVVQAWMYHANLLGGAIAKRMLGVPCAWGMHNSGIDPARASIKSRTAFALSRATSARMPDLKISCSQRARAHLIAAGFDPHDWQIIPNGYDLSEFRFSGAAREAIRSKLGVRNDEFLIGTVARWHPDKNHDLLFEALSWLPDQPANHRAVLIGPGMTSENGDLRAALAKRGLRDKVILYGATDDVPAIMSALDLHVLPSAREAFPNVVCEAMACETPVVCTDAGDAAEIVGPLGPIVPRDDAQALADHIGRMAVLRTRDADWRALKTALRHRIDYSFSIDRMRRSYEAAWQNLAAKRP